MEWQGSGMPVLMVVNSTTIHSQLESKGFSSTPGKFWLLLPSFILGFKSEPYKSWVTFSEQTVIYNGLMLLSFLLTSITNCLSMWMVY